MTKEFKVQSVEKDVDDNMTLAERAAALEAQAIAGGAGAVVLIKQLKKSTIADSGEGFTQEPIAAYMHGDRLSIMLVQISILITMIDTLDNHPLAALRAELIEAGSNISNALATKR